MVLLRFLLLALVGVSACPINSHKNASGRCVCDGGWTGDTCKHYIGQCADRCDTCSSPAMGDCTRCVANAVMNSHGICECQADFGGDRCDMHMPSGKTCDPICFEGCSGPTAFDCVYCVSRAHRGANGECICDLNWTGPSCEEHVSNETVCHPRCKECMGSTIYDCSKCIT